VVDHAGLEPAGGVEQVTAHRAVARKER